MPRRRFYSAASSAWKLYANLAGLSLVALAIAYAIASAAGGNDAVFVASDVRPIVTKAAPGGFIEYVYTQNRVEECPGKAVEIFSVIPEPGKGSRDATIREQRRPVVYTKAQRYDDLHIKVNVPGDLPEGRYRFHDYILSQCPLREQIDNIADFPVEIRK